MCRYDLRKRTIPWFEWDSAGPGLIGTMCDPRSRARADLWRLGAAMAFAGGHGGPRGALHGPLSLGLFVDLSVGGRGPGATLGRGRLLPRRGFRLSIHASEACCSSCFNLTLPATASALKDTRGQKHTRATCVYDRGVKHGPQRPWLRQNGTVCIGSCRPQQRDGLRCSSCSIACCAAHYKARPFGALWQRVAAS